MPAFDLALGLGADTIVAAMAGSRSSRSSKWTRSTSGTCCAGGASLHCAIPPMGSRGFSAISHSYVLSTYPSMGIARHRGTEEGLWVARTGAVSAPADDDRRGRRDNGNGNGITKRIEICGDGQPIGFRRIESACATFSGRSGRSGGCAGSAGGRGSRRYCRQTLQNRSRPHITAPCAPIRWSRGSSQTVALPEHI